MRQLAGRGLRRLFRSAGRARLGLVVLAGLTSSVAHAQPANDNFTNAINLTAYGDSGSTNGSNVGATIQPGEQNLGAFAGYVVSSVWYSWTASTNETTEFDPTGSLFGTNLTVVQIFTNSASGISNLRFVADSYYGYYGGSFYNYTGNFQAVAGQTYYISVGGYYYPSATGSFQLNWSSSPLQAPPPNEYFASATVLTGEWGVVSNNNTGATADVGAPNIAGFPPNHPLWYQWTASHDGDVELDTLGSVAHLVNLDTVLGVYQGTTPLYLNQIAANDDLYPVNRTFGSSYGYLISPLAESGTVTSVFPAYYGPSHLRFTAKAGQVYYFAVDTKNGTTGNIVLSWAYKSSGVFGFASEDQDSVTGLPLYQTAETESETPQGSGNVDVESVEVTYYNYNAPGALVTVTRKAGATGRAIVDYQTEDGTSLPGIPLKDQPGIAGQDYALVSGQLVFDDFEMSKTILIPIYYQLRPGDQSNRVFGVTLSNPQLDPLEDSSSVAPPRIDPVFGTAVVKILNTDADPYGPDIVPQVITNMTITVSNSVAVTNYTYSTNHVVADYPTNNIFNFEKANYRVPADVNDSSISPFNYASVTIYVERFGTNTSAETINYRVDSELAYSGGTTEFNDEFPLQPGSDYAVPLPANKNVVIRDYTTTNYDRVSTNYDFDVADGTLNFPGGNLAANYYQPIHITLPVSKATKFNKDFRLQLYHMVGPNTRLTGMNAETTITILFNDENPPAGSVDEFYNADFNSHLAVLPPPPPTTPGDNSNPGVGSPLYPGQVYGIAVLPNDEALIGGDFSTYNGSSRGGVALIQTNGQVDTSFLSGSGVAGDLSHQGYDAVANAVAVSGNQFYIAGNFTSYRDLPAGGIARVNANGSPDTTFNKSIYSGADGVVRALAVQGDGQVLIGGDFTHVNGVARNYIARLNTDGSVDTTFDPSTTLTGPVYALALPQTTVFKLTRSDITNSANEDVQVINLGQFTAGTLTINLNNYFYTNVISVFYGGTNTLTGAGVYLGGGTNTGTGTLVLPFAPTPALLTVATNQLIIVMNQGGAPYPAPDGWQYTATVTVPGNQGIFVGGNFSVAGQAYTDIARLSTNGTLDTSFNPGSGLNGIVHALAWQLDGQIVAGGEFKAANGLPYNHIVRFNADGSIDTANFFAGTGADDAVYSINLQPLDGSMYVGGAFSSFNGTRRAGFTRLYANGTVDTTFMDTAYNQFAGLKKIFSSDSPAVFASAVQNNGGVLIGGSFLQVGGGQADPSVCNSLDDNLFLPYFGSPESFADPYLWVEPKTRDGVRNRTGFARLVGGSTPGPGNIGLNQTTYSQSKSQTPLTVAIVRTSGTLGPVSANFSVLPGLALAGKDYRYQSAPPLYWIAWNYLNQLSRMREDGLWGVSGNSLLVDALGASLSQADSAINNLAGVVVSIIPNQSNPGNLNAQFQMANPNPDTFYLGGEEIPLGTALGASSAPFSLIDDTTYPGQFGFTSTSFVATNSPAIITMVRSNGTFGPVSMFLNTTNGTAVAGSDYVALHPNTLVYFNRTVATVATNVTILNFGYSANVEKEFNVKLSGPIGQTPGATFGISNAVVRIINPNVPGYVTLSTNNYAGTITSGALNFTVNRVVGSLGSISVQYATTDGPSATNGVDYVGSTNTLSWNSGDVSQKILSVPLIQTGAVGANRQFGVSLFNPKLGSTNTPLLMGSISNATLTIINDNNAGTLQFSAPAYTVNENGGYATITVVRTGGSAGTISAHYATSDGTALADVDQAGVTNYIATGGTVTLASGQIATNFTVPILDDGVVDPPPANFYFNVSLVGPGISAGTAVHIVDAETYNRPAGSPDTAFLSSGVNGSVSALSLNSSAQILAGGNFTYSGVAARGHVARLNTDGTLDGGFLNGLDGANAAVYAVLSQTTLADADRVLIGGAFTTVNSDTHYFVARLMTDGTVDSSFKSAGGADGVVNAIAEAFAHSGTNQVRKIYLGGAFGSFAGSSSPGVVRLNNDGSVDYGFNVGSGADGPVYALAVYPASSLYAGKVLVGGSFAHFKGTGVNNLVRLNADGALDTSYNASLGLGPSGAVHALAVQPDGRVLIGGSFTNFNGAPMKYVCRLNPDGTVDTNFTAATSDSVEGIALQSDNRIVLVGQFTQANGVTRNHITRLLPTGATDPSINFGDGANGDVDTVLVQPSDGMLLIGGNFSQYDDQPHANIARIYGGSITGSGQFEFTAANYQVLENSPFALLTIRRTGGTSGTNADGSGDVFVNFATTAGTAVPNVNYTPVNLNVDFPAGEVLRTVSVPVMDDHAITPDLTLTNVLSSPTPPAGLGPQPYSVLTIVNVDSGVSFLSPPVYSVQKNVPSGVATIDIIRQGGTNNPCTVDFNTTTTGTAVAGTDYYPTNVLVTFNPGDSDVQVQVPIINNGLPEGNRTVGLALANGVNTLLIPPSNATLTIVDTTTNAGQLRFSAANYVANSAAGYAVVTIVRTNGSHGPASAYVETIPGTALPGVDYNPPSITNVSFSDGDDNPKSFYVQLVNSSQVKGPVSFSMQLVNPSGAELTDPTNTTVTILNNNFGVAFLNSVNYASETNSPALIFVQRLGNPTNAFQVNYATTNGTAVAGVNYTATSNTLAFAGGEVLKTISVPLINQHMTTNLTFGMTLFNPTGGAQLGAPSNTLIVLQGSVAGLSFINPATSVFKNAGTAVIPVVCSNPGIEPVMMDSNTVPLSVQYYTVDGTAVSGQDYTGVSGMLVFTNGLGTGNIRIPILNNTLITGQRTFTVVLTNATAPGKITSPSNHVVTIIDSNAGLSFSSPYYTVNKTNVTATITVIRTDNINQVSTVNYATADGTAVAPGDYTPTNGTCVFSNGVTSQTFEVRVIAGNTVQPDKTVLLQLSNPTGGFLAPPSAATLTIHDTSGSLVVPAGSAFAPNGDPNHNGLIDPNETVTLLFAFRVAGGNNVTNLYATLLATGGVTAPSPATPVSYGQLVTNGPSASRAFSFTAVGTNGQRIAATFLLTNGTTGLGTALFTYTLGSWTTVFSNTSPIVINAAGPASPYPSTITVSNVGGVLLNTVITLTNISHTAPAAINALLVSPNQNDTLFMSHAGGGQFGGAINGVTLKFDDSTNHPGLPFNGQITNGVYNSTQYGGAPVFP